MYKMKPRKTTKKIKMKKIHMKMKILEKLISSSHLSLSIITGNSKAKW